LTEQDARITAAFVRSRVPVTYRDLMERHDISAKQARRYFGTWHKAGLATPRGYRGRAPTWGVK